MTAVRGYGLIYSAVTRGLDEDEKLKVDALLGDKQAQATIDKKRLEVVELGDWEVG